MSQSDRAIKKFATQLARLDREVKSWRGAQADFTSIENGGNFTFKDGDGNVTAIVGGQDDGSNTIRHVDGPTPPVPSGLSAHVDGPIVQVSWDGTFESSITHDWHYLEVLAVGPNDEQLTGTINDLSGGETSLAATSQGDWVITARSVSRAGKRSLDGDAGTVAVQLVGLTGAIEAVQESANGKNTIYYSPTEPDAPDGGFNNGDLWFDTSEEGNNTASVWDGNGWVSMEDARLATIIAAQEALESDLQDVQTSVDGKNKITYDPALPPASYVGAVGDTWYRTSGNSMIGFWKWDGAAWIQQELSTTVIPQIDIGAGTFGTLNGSRLIAESITADKLLIGGASNMIANPSFESGSAGWVMSNITPDSTVSHSGTQSAKMMGSSGTQFMYQSQKFNVVAGDTYRVSVWAMVDNATGTSSKGGGFRIHSANPDGTPGAEYANGWVSDRNWSHRGWDTPGEWFWLETQWVAPVTDAVIIRIAFTANHTRGTRWVDDFAVVPMTDSTLITPGAITTEKLAVGSITAESGVIASLDLGKATVGELDGIRIMGQSVRGEQLSGDAIDGKVITGPTIQSGRSGRRWIGDPSGIRIINDDDDVRTQLSPEGSTFKGEVEADTLVVNEGAEFNGNNTLAQGAKLTLAAGVTDPTATPAVQPHWEGVEFNKPEDTNLYGLAYADGKYWTFADIPNSAEGDEIISIDPTTGAIVDSLPLTGGFWAAGGVTAIGNELFMLGRKDNVSYKYFVRVMSTTGAVLREWEYEQVGWSPTNRLVYKPGIGTDGTNVVIAQCDDLGSLIWRTFNKTTGALLNTVDRGDKTKSDITGIYIGPGDWGSGTRVAVAKNSTSTIQVFTTNGSATEWSWYTAGTDDLGVVFADGKFCTLAPNGVINQYADNNTGDGSGDWWAAYRWRKQDLSGSATSRISPATRFVWPRRSKIKIIGSPLPVSVTRIDAFVAKTPTTPMRENFRNANTSPRTGQPVATLSALPPDWQVWPVPADSNTFPNATPSTMKSASNTFVVNGDGTGHWGPITWNSDGTIRGATEAGTAIVPINAANSNRTLAVTFTTGRFKTPPTVVATPVTPDPQAVQVSVSNITATGFTMVARRTVASGAYVTWVATEG